MNRIHIIRSNAFHEVEDACRKMLAWWLDSERDKATWRRLIRAIEDSKSDFFVLARDIETALGGKR